MRALGDFEILAPIREIQQEVDNVRHYEREYLEERGFSVRAKTTRYTINENVLGVTISGSEIDRFEAPGEETYQITSRPKDWSDTPIEATLTFENGVATELDGEALEGPELLSRLNARFGKAGVGRAMYTGDTTIGLKGRIVFEAPGIVSLMVAHRALEEAILTNHQNSFKPVVASKWVELVYKGFFYEPLKIDLETFLESSQRFIEGKVTLSAVGGQVYAVKVDSDRILHHAGAVYAQSADWGATEAEGFIKLYGQSSALSAQINPLDLLEQAREE